jgi:hypothetical protein
MQPTRELNLAVAGQLEGCDLVWILARWRIDPEHAWEVAQLHGSYRSR